MSSPVDELVNNLPTLFPSSLLSIIHAQQTERDTLWCYIPPVTELIVLFNVDLSCFEQSYTVSGPGCCKVLIINNKLPQHVAHLLLSQ